MNFSERYGYVKPSEVLKRGLLDDEGQTALCNCFDYLAMWFNHYDVNSYNHRHDQSYTQLEEAIWCFFMNQRRASFYRYNGHQVVATEYLLSNGYEWYYKFDMIEFAIRFLRQTNENNKNYQAIVDNFIKLINSTFQKLNYAYRVINNEIVEITSQEEIVAIESAINDSVNNVKMHLQTALELLAKKPVGDYRNSIKESISAVEAVCRERTGKNTLGDALNDLSKKGVEIPGVLKVGLEKIYGYTNNKETGIRHALMVDEGTYMPSSEEAIFMLISCSAFVNYLYAKISKKG